MNFTESTDAYEERFWRKVEKSSSCWIFSCAKDSSGYGAYGVGGKTMSAHRFAWMLFHGPIPAGLCVCHRCDNPPCVRAECAVPGCAHGMLDQQCESHLFLGTHQENHLDRALKNIRRKKLKDNDDPARLPNGRKRPTTLSREQIDQMRSLAREGSTLRELAERFGVSLAYVQQRTLDIPKMRWRGKRKERPSRADRFIYQPLPLPLNRPQIEQAVVHINNGGRAQDMATMFGISLQSMCCYLRDAGIETAPKSEAMRQFLLAHPLPDINPPRRNDP